MSGLPRFSLRGLSAGILLAMGLGLVLPALIGALLLTGFRSQQLDAERQHDQNEKIEVVSHVLAQPLWSFDVEAIRVIGNTVMLDPQVIHFEVRDSTSRVFVALDEPSRRLGQVEELRRPILQEGRQLGEVSLQIDDGLRQIELRRERRFLLLLLAGQFLLGFGLVYLALRRRVLRPLQQLTAFSSQIARGQLDTPVQWSGADEIGLLARQLDQMRADLSAAALERAAVLDNIRVGVVFLRHRRVILANQATERIFRAPPGGLLGLNADEVYLSRQQSEQVATSAYGQIASSGGCFEAELQLRRLDGEVFWALLRGSALNPAAVHEGSVWIFEDITQRREASEQLRLSATVFENTADAVVIINAQQAIVAVNRSFSQMTGYAADEVVGQTLAQLQSERNHSDLYQTQRESLRSGRLWQGELWIRKHSGETFLASLTLSTVRDEAQTITQYVGVFQDITYKKATEREIRFLAYHDPLTSLPNRKALLDALQTEAGRTGLGQATAALLLIDLDNFKILNDSRGHDVGDQLLVEAARRLQALTGSGNVVARIGGDEFVLLLTGPGPDPSIEQSARRLARAILDALALPFRLRQRLVGPRTQELQHQCTASIGIALFGDRPQSVEEILKQADTAMYRAKAAGRNTALFYHPGMQDDIAARALLEWSLHQAVREAQFMLVYQAQVGIDRQVLGAEALIRWNHPERGLVSPLAFIPLAEEVGLILQIGEWVLNTACAQLAAWSQDPHLAGLSLSVNVSAKQFLQTHFVDQVLNAVHLHGASPGRLKLEITESLLMHDLVQISDKMNTLKQHGIRFSLDDFGTGYSSLSYLQRLPFDQLKIDRAFVSGLGQTGDRSPIVSAIIALGHNLGLNVIAEGVETEAQRDFLAANNCLAYQGYLYHRPMPAADFDLWMAAQQAAPAASRSAQASALTESPPSH